MMKQQLRTRRLLAVLAAAALAACSSGDSTTPDGGNNGGQTPAISLQLSTSSISVVPGASTSGEEVSVVQDASVALTATIARSGGFTGSVNIAVSGAPTGVSATASPSTIPGDATTSTINVTAAANAAAGNSTLTVTASGTGVSSVTATFQVTVTAVSPGSFSLALTPTSLSVQQGQQGTSTVNITRAGGFTGSVALSATAPTGLTATLNPASTTSGSSTLTVTASSNVAAGSYTVTVTGTATGLTQQAVSLAVAVTASSSGGGNVSFTYCANEIPTWVAYQDGTGSWTRVNPVGSTFTFPINSGRGGVAIVKATSGSELQIYYGTTTELSAFGSQCGSSSTATKTLMGSVSGLGATDQAYISFGGGTAAVSALGATNFTLTGVRDGTHDLVASRTSFALQGQTVITQVISMIIRRALNPANGSTLPDLNLAGPESFAPVQKNLTINNLGSDQSIVSGLFVTTGGGVATLYTDVGITAGSARQYYGVPNANRMSGDLHLVTVSALAGMTATNLRGASIYFAEALDKAVTLGPALTGVNVTTVATTPYARVRAMYPIQSQYADFLWFGGTQATGNRSFFIYASKAYLNGATTYDVTVPDFSSVTDWLNIWGPQTGVVLDWQLSGTGFSVPGGLFTPVADGVISLSATTTGTITP